LPVQLRPSAGWAGDRNAEKAGHWAKRKEKRIIANFSGKTVDIPNQNEYYITVARP
jgi:hypothetical protein